MLHGSHTRRTKYLMTIMAVVENPEKEHVSDGMLSLVGIRLLKSNFLVGKTCLCEEFAREQLSWGKTCLSEELAP